MYVTEVDIHFSIYVFSIPRKYIEKSSVNLLAC